MTNWGLAALVVAGEGIVFTQTIKVFGIESSISKRGEDLRRSKVGFEVAVMSKLAEIYEEAEAVKRPGEELRDALTGSNFNDELPVLAELAPRIYAPARCEKRLKYAAYCLLALMVTGHVSAALFSIDNIIGHEFLPDPWDGIACVVFIAAVVSSLTVALVVWRWDAAFERIIRDGKAANA